MGAMRQKIGHRERLRVREREREATKNERERKGEQEEKKKSGRGGGELRENEYPEIQASINGAEHACIVAANSEWCINTGLVLGCPSKSVVCV